LAVRRVWRQIDRFDSGVKIGFARRVQGNC